jgi:putative ABC transport system permease protein
VGDAEPSGACAATGLNGDSYPGPPRGLATIKREVQAIDPGQPVHRIEMMEEKLGASAAQPRFTTLVLTLFAALAVLLAVVGTYGVVSYVVVLRTHEIGIRMALGAGRSKVIAMVLRQGWVLWPSALGSGCSGRPRPHASCEASSSR